MKKYIGLSLLSTLAFANTVTIDGDPGTKQYNNIDEINIKYVDATKNNLIIRDDSFSKTVVNAMGGGTA